MEVFSRSIKSVRNKMNRFGRATSPTSMEVCASMGLENVQTLGTLESTALDSY